MEAPDYQHLIHVYLIELNLFEAESRVLDTRVLEGCYFSFIQDEKDRLVGKFGALLNLTGLF